MISSETPTQSDPNVSLDDEDWFGDGSAFDSGEELAAALMSMSGSISPAATQIAASRANDAQAGELPAFEAAEFPPLAGSVPEFQIGSSTSPTGAGSWNRRVTSGDTRWSIRNSVKTLKMTEDVVRRLREEAVEVAWRAASISIRYAGRN